MDKTNNWTGAVASSDEDVKITKKKKQTTKSEDKE